MIQTENLTKTYQNGFQAVKGLNLQVNKGNVFGFLGPNGAGKTTTIRMLDGLLAPTTGTVMVAGMNVQKHKIEIKKMIGVVPESHGYYYWMTPKEYLEYFSALFERGTENKEYIRVLFDKVGLLNKANVPIREFSRGMKQRLGIAKALINHPKIIFLDEPTLGLDPKGQREIQELLQDINKENEITIFITSHLLKDIEVLCNSVAIVQDGTLVEQGSITELRAKYEGAYTLAIQTDDNINAIRVIRDFSGVEHVGMDENGKLAVSFQKDITTAQAGALKHKLIGKLLLSNIELWEMSKKTLSMEDIFFQVTEGKDGKNKNE